MTPKEKAKELIEQFKEYAERHSLVDNPDVYNNDDDEELYNAKQCALIAVDEIMEAIKALTWEFPGGTRPVFWEEVKEEIEKL